MEDKSFVPLEFVVSIEQPVAKMSVAEGAVVSLEQFLDSRSPLFDVDNLEFAQNIVASTPILQQHSPGSHHPQAQ